MTRSETSRTAFFVFRTALLAAFFTEVTAALAFLTAFLTVRFPAARPAARDFLADALTDLTVCVLLTCFDGPRAGAALRAADGFVLPDGFALPAPLGTA